nr:interleukin 17-10 [Sepiella japonica]
MKIPFTIVLYFAMICISTANLKQLKLNRDTHVQASNMNKIDSFTFTKKEPKLVCPDGPPTSIDAPLNERAICPWIINKTIDKNRIPEVIEEAVCSCKECSNIGTCIPSYAEVSVLRKISNKTVVENLKVAVACNCIMSVS